MTSPLDEKGLGFAAIEMAKLRGMSCLDEVDQRMYGAEAARVIRAYLSTAPAPDALEVVGYLFDLRYGPDHWSKQRMFSNQLPNNPGDVRNVEPLVRRSQAHSTIAALRAEIERLRNMVDGYGKLDAEYAIAESRAEIAEAEVKRLTEEKEALSRALFDLHEAVDSEIDIGAQSSAFRKRVVVARKAMEARR